MAKFSLALLIHAHQPIGNFDDVMERTFARSYLPFVECLEKHPAVRIGLHYSGSLLEWLEKHHPEYIQRLAALARNTQVEIVGGGFYEPILITIPTADQILQMRRLSSYITHHFGNPPVGAWLAERVWEPQLPAALAEAGVKYTLVDDSHFLAAGLELPDLYGYYIAEERGRTVQVIPGLQQLRYLLPFGPVNDAIEFLRGAAAQHPGGMAAMGDDMEKFGAWPHTWEHCFRDGWLEQFFTALEANQDWLEVCPPADALAARKPLGRADLPTASYTEMMEWVLPTSTRQKFHALQEEFAGRPDVRRFLRGGFWRGFFSKYPEANLLHKKMLRVSAKLHAANRKGSKATAARAEATTHLLRAQCNDAYWHGIFGGLYAPHLRTALWRELILAETLADSISHSNPSYHEVETMDFDADGLDEIEISSPVFGVLIKPHGGGTVEILDFRPNSVTLINSLQRRVEAYHSRLSDANKGNEGVASIHNQTLAKESGLENKLRYDRWPRHMFRLMLFGADKTHADFETLTLGENGAFAGGDYGVEHALPHEVKLSLSGYIDESRQSTGSTTGSNGGKLSAAKTLKFDAQQKSFTLGCRIELSRDGGKSGKTGDSGATVQINVGLEIVLNLLAPNAPDRYWEVQGKRHVLNWSGVVNGSQLRVVDEWQNVAVTIDAPGANQLWVAPIETVSESEEGFERVYQGSQILPVWTAQLSSEKAWTAEAILHVSEAHS